MNGQFIENVIQTSDKHFHQKLKDTAPRDNRRPFST